MRTYVSYVIQDEKGHKHESAVVTTESPAYSYPADPHVSEVMQWADKKKERAEAGGGTGNSEYVQVVNGICLCIVYRNIAILNLNHGRN